MKKNNYNFNNTQSNYDLDLNFPSSISPVNYQNKEEDSSQKIVKEELVVEESQKVADHSPNTINYPQKNLFQSRSFSRKFAMQAFYQWLLVTSSLENLKQQFSQNEEFEKIDQTYFFEILEGVLNNTDRYDQAIIPFLVDRPVDRLDAVERGILWLGTFELMHRKDVPYRVIINESVEIAKRFGAEGSHKFINSILDKVAKKYRQS